MTGNDLAKKAQKIAEQYSSLYVSGCFGAPMNAANRKRYANNNAYNRRPERQAKIYAAAANTFGFDCCGLVKAILWGWTGDTSQVYGGAVYPAGAFLYMPGHCGVYIGGGLAAEATPKWSDGVQLSAVANIGQQPGYNARSWSGWGLLPWLDYSDPEPLPPNFKDFNLLCNGRDKTARGIYEAGNWYIRLRDLEERLDIATVDYNPVQGLPVINSK